VRFERREQAHFLWNALMERGVYVNLVVPPATPDGSSLLRCSVSAGHTPEQITLIGNAFADVRPAGRKPSD
jgi:8-amino-7-oxononanoate synthase